MTKNNALKQLIVTIAITLLFTLNNGTAQTNNEEINSIAHNNVVNLVVDAFNDSSVSIALCKVPDNPWYRDSEVVIDSSGKKTIELSADLDLLKIQVIDVLRCSSDIDSLITLKYPPLINREGMENYFPLVNLSRGSEWLILLDSPFLMSRYYHASVMEKMEKYGKKLKGQAFLNSNNFFTLYELNAGALCTYFPEDAKYPPQFIYSKELVDDLKTIIELQENPSLLSESDDSYDTYYSSMNDDLGKRVFSRLFDNPNQE